jgi:hypothetical protein
MSSVYTPGRLRFEFGLQAMHHIPLDKPESVYSQQEFVADTPTIDLDTAFRSPLNMISNNSAVHPLIRNTVQDLKKAVTGDYSGLPWELLTEYEQPDWFARTSTALQKVRKHLLQQMIDQASRWIELLLRVSHRFVHNKTSIPCTRPLGYGRDQAGLFRLQLGCDLSKPHMRPYLENFQAMFAPYMTSHQVPLVFVVLIFRENMTDLNLFLRFLPELRDEYQEHILPIVKSPKIKDIPKSFWNVITCDHGLEDLAARIVIESYQDYFAPLDSDTLMDIWQHKSLTFDFTQLVQAIGKELYELIKTKYPRMDWDSISDHDIQAALQGSSFVECHLMFAAKCRLPLASFMRDLFRTQGSGRLSNISAIAITKLVTMYFVFSARPKLCKQYGHWATMVFETERHKEFFPSSVICAHVYHMIVAYALYVEQNRIQWTNRRYESDIHPSPWRILMERAMDLQGPIKATPNFSGFREFVQEMDKQLFRFVGGYIMHSNDQVCVTHFRKIRVALLRIGYLDQDRDIFFKDANSPGLRHNQGSKET